ncbi:unnamed protein product [Vicia faba]|uniref:EF-hand domain-containing protein n=1 Tax=Vicia faba TaxID=3906 RepID=A0AAV0ZK13_VICFA|nr:unnamed protein product [Vicia faba]
MGGGSVKKINPTNVSIDHVLVALGETKEERDIRIRSLFNFFDAGNNGYLNYGQIESGLSALQIPGEYKYARELFKVCDSNSDGKVDYNEFRRYMDAKELELYCIFQAIDVEHNGSILPEELWDALDRAGIEMDEEELARFVEHVDKDNNGTITFEEWRDFLLLYPHEATIENIYHHWERVYHVDIGDQAVMPEDISKHTHRSKYFIAGGIAGATSRTATAPLDRLKVVLQVQTTRSSAMSAVTTIWKQDKLRGFFRGGVAGGIAQTAIYPLDLIKTRLQTCASEGGRAPNLGTLTKNIWIQEGPRAFYRGLLPSVIGMIPYAGIDLAVYDTLKDMSRRYIIHDNDPGPLIQLGCGTISGTLGATCVYPLQVIRTRLQAQSSNSSDAYKGMFDAFCRTFQHEGFRGFYKGLLPNLLKVVPAASITYMVYERMKKNLELE